VPARSHANPTCRWRARSRATHLTTTCYSIRRRCLHRSLCWSFFLAYDLCSRIRLFVGGRAVERSSRGQGLMFASRTTLCCALSRAFDVLEVEDRLVSVTGLCSTSECRRLRRLPVDAHLAAVFSRVSVKLSCVGLSPLVGLEHLVDATRRWLVLSACSLLFPFAPLRQSTLPALRSPRLLSSRP